MPYPPYQIRFVAGKDTAPGPNEPPVPPDPETQPFNMDEATGGIRGSHRVKAEVPGGRVTLVFTHFPEAMPTKPNLQVEIIHDATGAGPVLRRRKAAARSAKKAAKSVKKAAKSAKKRPAKAAKRARKAGGRKTSGKRR